MSLLFFFFPFPLFLSSSLPFWVKFFTLLSRPLPHRRKNKFRRPGASRPPAPVSEALWARLPARLRAGMAGSGRRQRQRLPSSGAAKQPPPPQSPLGPGGAEVFHGRRERRRAEGGRRLPAGEGLPSAPPRPSGPEPAAGRRQLAHAAPVFKNPHKRKATAQTPATATAPGESSVPKNPPPHAVRLPGQSSESNFTGK